MRTVFTFLLLGMACLVTAQTSIPLAPSEMVTQRKLNGETFETVSLFKLPEPGQARNNRAPEGIRDFQYLDLDEEALQKLIFEEPEQLTLTLPGASRFPIEVELVKVQPFTHDFTVMLASTNAPAAAWESGVHYRGRIKGKNGSVAAVSLFENQVMGLFSAADQGNLVLGPMGDDPKTEQYLLYNDADALMGFVCATPDEGPGYHRSELEWSGDGRGPGDCVRIYFEVDHDIFLNKGGTTPTVNYVTGLFNQAAALYANENVNVTISQIYVWDTNSPYSGSSSGTLLNQFQNYRTSFNGDLGQLLSYQASGGIAVLNGLCHPYTYARLSFASINPTYNTVPTYSFSVLVVTHELGHLLGSHHTHACVWNGNNTAIDGCAGFTEGNCGNPGIPSGGGTIMSYCHITSAGINLSLGFGVQPGNVIRNKVANATCTQACSSGGGGSGGSGGGTGGGSGGSGGGSSSSCSGNEVLLTLVLDNYGPETTWQLLNSQGSTLESGGPYAKGLAGTIVKDTFCLPNGCYTFKIRDAYGDGICCQYGQGSYTLRTTSGQTIATGGSFTTEKSEQFCVPYQQGGGNNDCVAINFNEHPILSYGSGQDAGTYQLLNGGTVLKLQNNAWKAIAMDYNITQNTILEFDFSSTIEGEIHGIGFDDNNTISYNLTFKVHGTQAWGILDYDNYPGGAIWKHYMIPVGQYYYGQADRLFFAADHDVNPGNGNSMFRNVKIYELGGCAGNIPEGQAGLNPDINDGYNGKSRLSAYPSPATDVLQVSFQSPSAGNGVLRILDLSGRPVRELPWPLDQGRNAREIRLENLAPGAYLIQVDDGAEKLNQRFIIAK